MENNILSRTEQMRLHIKACTASELTVKAYCAQHGLTPSNYYYWLKKLQRSIACASSFIQISSPETQTDSSFATIRYPNGVSIELNNTINLSVLKELLCCI